VNGVGRAEGAAKVVTSLSSEELESVIGKRSEEVEAILGPGAAKVIARPEETVFLED
jgi:glutamate 5-kinase